MIFLLRNIQPFLLKYKKTTEEVCRINREAHSKTQTACGGQKTPDNNKEENVGKYINK